MDAALKEKADSLKVYLIDYLERMGLKKSASGLTSLYHCPICGSGTGRNKSGAFSVFTDKHGYPHWRCHACNKHGDLLELIQITQNCSWGKALKIASEIYLDGGSAPSSFTQKQKPAPVRSCIASVEKRNAFYTRLLERLPLFDAHKNELEKRGIPVSALWKYRSVPDRIYSNTTKEWLVAVTAEIITELGDIPDGVPGFYINDNGEWTVAFPRQGFLIPVNDLFGRIQGIQVRADIVKEGRKYSWVSSNPDPTKKHPFKNGTCAETAVHCHFVANPASDTVYITEGPLKGDIASILLNRNFIAVTGTTCLNPLSNVLSALKKRGIVRVVCAMDMDRYVNNNVNNAVNNIKAIVSAAGMEWHDFSWNPNFAQDGKYKGIDDWAVARIAKTA